METKIPSQPSLEDKLTVLKDQLIANINTTKLVVRPRLEGLKLYYEKRRGTENQKSCKEIKLGLTIIIKRKYHGNAEIKFEEINNDQYSASLEVLAETKEAEQQLAYDALSEINRFFVLYNEYKQNNKLKSQQQVTIKL